MLSTCAAIPEIGERNVAAIQNAQRVDQLAPEEIAATAVEACGTAHVAYSDTVTAGANCALDHIVQTIRRTWTATDDCGNSTTRSATVTVPITQ